MGPVRQEGDHRQCPCPLISESSISASASRTRAPRRRRHTYDFFRPLLRDAQSLKEFEFPAQYMFKDVPDVVSPDVDPVEWVVEKMDAFNIQMAKTGLSPNGIRARREYPGRFFLSMKVDPNDGIETLRQMERAKSDHDIVSVNCFPCGCFPQVAVNDKKMYPIYMKCVELGIPICINGGIVGPRMPSWPQYVEHFDEVCYDFPDLTMVMMHGGEPWTALAVKLMLKWPGLHYMTSAFAPKHYPKDIINYANTPRRRQDHVLRVLPRRADPRTAVPGHAERTLQGRRVAEVPAGERHSRVRPRRRFELRGSRDDHINATAMGRGRRRRGAGFGRGRTDGRHPRRTTAGRRFCCWRRPI